MQIVSQAMRSALESRLATLPASARRALILIRYEGYTVDQAAREMQLAPRHVRQLWQEAMQELIECQLMVKETAEALDASPLIVHTENSWMIVIAGQTTIVEVHALMMGLRLIGCECEAQPSTDHWTLLPLRKDPPAMTVEILGHSASLGRSVGGAVGLKLRFIGDTP